MRICKIIAEQEDDFKYLSTYLDKYPLELTQEVDIEDGSIPTLIVGWQTVKKFFKAQNIFDKKISQNITWAYNKNENESDSDKEIEKFVNNSIKDWLPSSFTLFDSLFHENKLREFFNNIIDKQEISYFYFNDGALYVYSLGKNYIINVKTLAFVYPNSKQILADILNNYKSVILSYKNISPYVDLSKLNCIYTFENIRWVKYKQEITNSYFQLIPGFKIDKYIPFIMSQVVNFNLNDNEKKSIQRACVRDKITEWLSEQTINFRSDFNKQGMNFIFKGQNKLFRVDYSNKRTLTGRIVPIGKYNPQNLPKNTEDRAQIISRFDGGKIVVFDYTSFESRIALYFCDDKDFISTYKKSDLHHEIATIIFKRDKISIEEREFSKTINHSILYGASKKTIIDKISYLGAPEETYYNILQFLAPILKKSKKIIEKFKKTGYVVNNWNTIIYSNKEYAAFNNYIQSTASEILIDKLFEIKEFLATYNSKFLFQVHDSLVFDIDPKEKHIIKELAKITMRYKELFFTISYSNGFDYKNLSKPIEVLDYSCI